MEKKILKALPVVFSLKKSGGYFHIISHTDASDRMAATWSRVGDHMASAVLKVGKDVERRKYFR